MKAWDELLTVIHANHHLLSMFTGLQTWKHNTVGPDYPNTFVPLKSQKSSDE